MNMKIMIIDSTNKREMIDINENDSISKLKELIKIKKGINTDDIVLHFNGEILELNQKISDYDIENNSQIIYTGKFRGGIPYKYF